MLTVRDIPTLCQLRDFGLAGATGLQLPVQEEPIFAATVAAAHAQGVDGRADASCGDMRPENSAAADTATTATAGLRGISAAAAAASNACARCLS